MWPACKGNQVRSIIAGLSRPSCHRSATSGKQGPCEVKCDFDSLTDDSAEGAEQSRRPASLSFPPIATITPQNTAAATRISPSAR
jgi:hypothetical protein